MKEKVKIHFLIAIFLLGHAHVSAQELAPSKSTYKPGEDVAISFSGGPGNEKDWVGIYKEGQTPSDDGSTQWKYVDGKTSGELVFDPLPLGKYEAHLLENDGYEILASTSFEVSEEEEEPKVSLSKGEYEIGEEIEISFSGGPGNKLDWIGMYQAGQEEISLWWYVDGTKEGNVGKESGVITVQPDLAVGSYNVSLFENDGFTVLATESVNIKEAPVVNKAPVVVEQSVEVNEDGSVSITLTGSDEDGDTLSFTVLSQPKKGTLSGTAPALSYSPKANYSGSDSFTYKANDGIADSNTATVTISVASVNDKPVVVGQSVEVNEDGSVSITLTGSDEDGDTLGFTVLSQPKNGKLSGTAPAVSYNPEANYSGSDSFTFKANDGKADSNTATVTIGVASVNDKPVVAGQSVEVNEDGSVSITLTGSDEDGDTLSFTVLSQPKKGTLSGTAPALSYSPKANYSGSDSFTFKANDGKADSNTATVTISVASVYDKPVVAGQSVEVNEDGSVSITLTGSDEDGDTLGFTVLSQPKNGTLSGTAPALSYSPKANYSGSDSFTFKANDGKADSNTATVTISVIENAVDKVELTLSKATYEEGEQIEINYTGGPGNAKDWVGVYKEGQKPGDHGSVQYQYLDGRISGELIFDPLPSGKYEVHLFENDSYQKLFTAHFNVRAAGRPWVTTSKSKYDFGETIAISYAGAPGNQKDWIGLHQEGKGGTWPALKHQQLKGEKSGKLEWDVTLEKAKKYNVSLYKGWSTTVIATAEFSISTKNIAAPVARSQKLNARAGKGYTVKLEGSDADGDAITYRIVSQPKHGILSGTIPNLIYTSNTDYGGSDSFTYVANDGELDSEIATVNFQISDKKPSKWTILFYMSTDNNLAASRVLKSKVVNALRTNKDVQLVTQLDLDTSDEGLMNKYGHDKEIVNDMKRLVAGLTVNGQTPPWKETVVERIKEGSIDNNRMDDPETLREFVEWGMTNFPAERYGLLFSDHGGAWSGFGGDHQDGFGSKENLKPRGMRKALQEALRNTGEDKFEWISFMACLMGSIEVLDAFDGLCDIFYGSPEISFAYNEYSRFEFIRAIMNDPNISNKDLASIEVDNWYGERHHKTKERPPWKEECCGSHAAYDMAKYEDFSEIFKKFSADILAEAKKQNPIILGARRETTHYMANKNWPDLRKPTTTIDLPHFVELLSKNVEGNLKASSTKLLETIDAMIIAKFVGYKRPAVSGLNIFYPMDGVKKQVRHSWDKSYFASGKLTGPYDIWPNRWDGVINYREASGTGGDWSRFLREIDTFNDSTVAKTQFVLKDDGSLVPSRSAEFGLAESGLMTASEKVPVAIEFEVEITDNAYDYFINLVSNRVTDNPNQFIYLGELHRGRIDGKNKHQYSWDTKLPILSLEGGGAKAPPLGSVGVDRKELEGEIPLYLGGWWSDVSGDMMVSYADYQGPGEGDKTQLILITRYLEGGAGMLESVLLDSSQDNSTPDGVPEDGENVSAPVGVGFEFEAGGKLWPIYYMEEPDSENPEEWKPYFTWFKDGYIKIPENGKDGLVINWVSVEPGDYRVEVQVGDYFGNLSDELKFDIRVEGDILGLPSLTLTREGARVVLSWAMEDGGDEAILQWADGLGGEWFDVPSSDLGFGGAGRLYKESARGKTRFYRLIKR